MKDDRSPKNYIADDPAKNDLGSTEMMSLPLWFKYLVVQKKSLILDMAAAWHFCKLTLDTKHLPSWPLKPRLCEAHPHVKLETPCSRRRIQNNIISFNNAIGTSDKGTKKWPPPLVFFCMFQKFLRMNQQFAPLEGQVDSKCFSKLGFNFLSPPPKKSATGPMPAKHWKDCLVLVQKGMAGQDCHGLYFKMVFFVKLMSS